MKHTNLPLSIFFSLILSYFLTFTLHAYIHNFLAYAYSLKDDVWYVDWSNLWLHNVTENTEFANLDPEGSFFSVGVVGFASYMVNWLLLILAIILLPKARKKSWHISFLYWLIVWNLTAVFSYIPQHLITSSNVTLAFAKLGISIWLIYAIGAVAGFGVTLALCYSYIQMMFNKLDINSPLVRRVYFTISIIIIFFYNTIHYLISDWSVTPIVLNIFFWLKLVVFGVICYFVNLGKTK